MKLTGKELRNHYGLLLGIEEPWQVEEVNLDLESKKVELLLVWSPGSKAKCPVCSQDCGVYDLAPERTWRHLDTMQFETIIRARTPRIECSTHGVKTIQVPWAEPHVLRI
jgi:transposase